MANYKTMYDILKNPLSTRRERYGTTDIRKITIDGNEFGGYKAFSSFWEKTYVKEPTRSASGVIDNLNSYTTFVTFHLKCDFAMMSIDDYRRLYDLMLDRNEFTVTAYNVLTNSNYTCKMYFAPDQMPKLYMVARKLNGESFTEVLGVQDYTIELIGTNASMEKVEIRYYDENNNLIANSVKSVDKGVETIVNYDYTPTNGRFDGKWQKNDVEEAFVFNGSVITPTDNVKLKAVVVPTNQYTLSLDYGVGIKPIPQDSSKQIDSFTITYNLNIANTISDANITLSDGNKFILPTSPTSGGTGVADVTYNNKTYSGSEAYSFEGWYWTTEINSETKVDNSTNYTYALNRTIHQIYQPKPHTITFNTNDSAITLSNSSARYGENVNVPTLNKSGKTFKGWFWKDGDVDVAFNGIMPPFTLNLFAKWES